MSILKFPPHSPKTKTGMIKQIQYILREDKTEVGLYGGKDCNYISAKSVINDFISTKEDYNKMSGLMTAQFIISIPVEDNISYEKAKEAAEQVLLHPRFDGFQIVYAVHQDTEHINIHFIINTVNEKTGLKWHQSRKELADFKKDVSRYLEPMGISPILDEDNCSEETKQNKKSLNDKEHYPKQNARSWKHEFYLAADYAIKLSTSREDFIYKMGMFGYAVDWTNAHQNILLKNKSPVTNSDGEQKIYKCRMNKLHPPERFAKEAMEKTFEENAQAYTADELDYKKNKLMELFNEAQEANPNCPLAELERIINESERNRLNKFARTQKGELFQAVVQTLHRSTSREDFIYKMKQAGYKVNWQNNRKYVLFEKIPVHWQVPDENGEYKEYTGREYKCRNNRLYPPERFTKEAMEERFEKNLQYRTQEQLDASMSLFLKAIQLFRQSEPEYPMSSMAASGHELSGAALKEYMYNFEEGSLYNENLSGKPLNKDYSDER